MRGINWREEKGSTLINVVFLIIIFGIIGVNLTQMVLSDVKVSRVQAERSRAFYAAHAGVEYGIRRVLSTLPENFSNWSETLTLGSNLEVKVNVTFTGSKEAKIIAIGKVGNAAHRQEKNIDCIDVSDYAIYAAGEVVNTAVHTSFTSNGWEEHHPELIYQKAKVFPIFDLEYLKNISIYHSGNYTLPWWFDFGNPNLEYIEGNLTVPFLSFVNSGHFIVGGDVHQVGGLVLPHLLRGTLYQPNSGTKYYRSSGNRPSVLGGIITAGDVIGGKDFQITTGLFGIKLYWWKNLHVVHNRTFIRNFMEYSVNEGPLLIEKSRWTQN
ncbi:MAG: hypothetical protein Kow0037_12130 [Calditrichia bacterium]